MAKNISTELKFYYDEELFNNSWENEKDPVTLALLESGAMVLDKKIEAMIAGGSNLYTIPFYKDITGEELNYDGKTDNVPTDTEGGGQTGVVWGREKAFYATVFVDDFSSADPMGNILRRIKKYQGKKRQARLIKILQAILGITGNPEWEKHKMNLAIQSAEAPVTEANKIGLTTLRDVAVQAVGDQADMFSLAIMHSQVANTLSKFNVLEYFKMNDARGQELDVKVGRSGNMMVIAFDGVPATAGSKSKKIEYTTFLLGRGVIRYAPAPVDKPTYLDYDAEKNGGTDILYTKYRETMHPNGFSFKMSDLPVSPLDTDLGNKANWKIEMNPQNIAIAELITNG